MAGKGLGKALLLAAAVGGTAVLMTLEWLEDPQAGTAEKLLDLVEIVLLLGTAGAVAVLWMRSASDRDDRG